MKLKGDLWVVSVHENLPTLSVMHRNKFTLDLRELCNGRYFINIFVVNCNANV